MISEEGLTSVPTKARFMHFVKRGFERREEEEEEEVEGETNCSESEIMPETMNCWGGL